MYIFFPAHTSLSTGLVQNIKDKEKFQQNAFSFLVWKFFLNTNELKNSWHL